MEQKFGQIQPPSEVAVESFLAETVLLARTIQNLISSAMGAISESLEAPQPRFWPKSDLN